MHTQQNHQNWFTLTWLDLSIQLLGFRYFVAFTDGYSGARSILENKSDTVAATGKFQADTGPYVEVKCIRSDNGGEFISKGF